MPHCRAPTGYASASAASWWPHWPTRCPCWCWACRSRQWGSDMETLSNLALGFSQALAPESLLYCLLGVTLGTFVGVLPGIGSLTTIALCLPLTFHLDP